MSAGDKRQYFSNPPPSYYRMVATLVGLAVVLQLYVAFLCLRGRTYWPLLLIGVTIWLAAQAIRNLLVVARKKENEEKA